MNGSLHAQVLARAAAKIGRQALRRHLHVSLDVLEDWLEGRKSIPTHAFLRAVDLISEDAPGRATELRTEANAVLDDAIRDSGAARGTLQILHPDGLRIVGQRGFEPPFLDFFAVVNDAGCACGSALQSLKRVVVAEVATHPLFAGTAAGGVLEEAGCRAVQSTPLLGTSGTLLGMLSTHYARPHEPSAKELAAIDAIAAQAAPALERLLPA